jgi:mevalonate kinase
MIAGRGRAGGKVILLGEHVVVYGRPAVAAGLPIGLVVEVAEGVGPRLPSDDPALAADPRPTRMLVEAAESVGLDAARVVARIRSELPPGRGLGSSAALAVATLRAVAAAAGRVLDPASELALGRRLEATFHGTPSGIDPAAAALGRCFRFVRGDPPVVTPLRVAAPLPLVIAFGDRPRSTGAAVGGLRARWEADRARYDAWFDAVAAVVERGVAAIEGGDLAALGRAFDDNQTLLEAIGVSSAEVGALVATARQAGALGAKLTGGGAGGAVIALAERPETVAARLEQAGATVLVVRIA